MVNRLLSFLAGSLGSASNKSSAILERSLGRESHVHPIWAVQ
jgi:hypothetical protein